MKVMAEVTVDLGEENTSDDEESELAEDNTVVGELLEDDESEAKENWQRLVRKLSQKKKKSIKKKKANDTKDDEVQEIVLQDDEVEEIVVDEDDVPDDWQQDYVSRYDIPDVVPVETLTGWSKDDDELMAIARLRCKKRCLRFDIFKVWS